MTREEAIKFGNMWLETFEDAKDSNTYNFFKISIEALKQEPILNKIRANIWDLQYGDEEKSMTDEDRADAYNNAIRQVIEIIDMYKAESEVKDGL